MADPQLHPTVESTATEIAAMEIRGAATIAVAAATALRYVLQRMDGETVSGLRASVIEAADEFVDRLDGAQTDLGAVGANRPRNQGHITARELREMGVDVTPIVDELWEELGRTVK